MHICADLSAHPMPDYRSINEMGVGGTRALALLFVFIIIHPSNRPSQQLIPGISSVINITRYHTGNYGYNWYNII